MKTIIGLFDDYGAAAKAVSLLLDRGVARADISVVVHDAARRWGHEMPDVEQRDVRNAAMAEAAESGAGVGAALGAGVGGVVGILAGAGVLVLPGIGPVVAFGPLLAGLMGAGGGAAAGGLVGGLVGALTKIGVPERDAQFYAEALRRGGTLVVVRAEDDAAGDVADTLGCHGAVDVDQRRAHFEARGVAAFDPNATPLTADEVARERELAVGAASTSPGGARTFVML